MNIKQVLGMQVLDNEANLIGKVSDFEFEEISGQITHLIVSQKAGLLAHNELAISFEDIDSIGDYILLKLLFPV
jgi:sporulation protein YlmC with PRC-barrel domain